MADLEDRPVILPRADHPISRRDIDANALKVLYRLRGCGYQAYLVGGGVRDLLLGRRPKDFDIGTDARPGEIRKIFRNCRLIGRRFRLAHIHFRGQDAIEVSTFRRREEFVPGAEGDEAETAPAETDPLLVRDNTYGTAEEDAHRRDFTINGLFYDIGTFRVLDYVGGLRDLEQRLIRSIGEAELRVREDPVRMIRAVRFASRLGFGLAPDLLEAIRRHGPDLDKCARPRLLLEVNRILTEGHARESLAMLADLGLLEVLLPQVAARRDRAHPPQDEALRLLDQRVLAGRPPGPAVFLSLLFQPLLVKEAAGAPEPSEAERQHRLREAAPRVGVTRRQMEQIGLAYAGRDRLLEADGRPLPQRLQRRGYFQDAADLYRILQAAAGEEAVALENWAPGNEAESEPGPGRQRRRKRKRRRRPRRRRPGGQP